jgi:hypothetical protein
MPLHNNRGAVTKQDMTRKAVVMEQLSEYVSAEKTTCNNRRAVFSVRSVPRGYKKDKEGRFSQFNFETPACQDMSLGAEEMN